MKKTFTYSAQPGNDIQIIGTFTDWNFVKLSWNRQHKDYRGQFDLYPGKHLYRFIDDGSFRVDANNPQTELVSGYRNSVIVVPEPNRIQKVFGSLMFWRVPPEPTQWAKYEEQMQLALAKCETAAQQGSSEAKKNLEFLKEKIEGIVKSLDGTLQNYKKLGLSVTRGDVANNTKGSDISVCLEEQMSIIKKELQELPNLIGNKLSVLCEQQSFFTIVLFGRTMVGKSTMMEILVHGNGESIGKGAQRTTRDVRGYSWHNMRVVDVPGIAAVDGIADEKLALEEAEKADMILFLISDAPQKEEAGMCNHLRRLGKPILGVLNIKLRLFDDRDPDSVEMFFEELKETLEGTEPNEIAEQFNEILNHESQGTNVDFAVAHLHSRFASTLLEYADLSQRLREASHFATVEERILGEVQKNGEFFRVKTFVDVPIVQSEEFAYLLLRGCTDNQNLAILIGEKNEKLESWKKDFLGRTQSRFKEFATKCHVDITGKIEPFIETYWNNENGNVIETAWERKIESLQIENCTNGLIAEVNAHCGKYLSEIIRQINQETTYISEVSKRADIIGKFFNNINNSGRMVGRIAKGVFDTITGILSFFDPISAFLLHWAERIGEAIVKTVGNWWNRILHGETSEERRKREEKERQEEIQKHKDNMRNGLRKSADEIKKELESQLNIVYENLKKSINDAQARLSQFQNVMTELFHQQGNLVNQLFQRVRELNKQMFIYLMNMTGSMEYQQNVQEVLRVPGEMLCILVKGDVQPLEAKKNEWEDILKEIISFVNYSPDNLEQMIAGILQTSTFSINRECLEIRIKGDYNVTRAKLAEQLTGLRTTQE